MNILTDDTSVKLMCCADGFEGMLAKGVTIEPKHVKLAIDAMREAIQKLADHHPTEELRYYGANSISRMKTT